MRDMLCSGEKILDLLKIDYRFQAAEISTHGGEAEGVNITDGLFVNVDSRFLRVYDSFERQNRGRRSVLN